MTSEDIKGILSHFFYILSSITLHLSFPLSLHHSPNLHHFLIHPLQFILADWLVLTAETYLRREYHIARAK